MAHLANVTRVRTLTTTRRVRALPRFGQVRVPVGRDVEPATVVARGPSASAFLVLRASDALKVPPEKMEEYLLAKEGAELERGEPLMRKPGAFGRSKTYRCPADGTLVQVRTVVLSCSEQASWKKCGPC